MPERLSGGDDSSENSSESSCYEVMDTNGEMVHMAKRLTCRVEFSFFSCRCTGIKLGEAIVTLSGLLAAGADQGGHRSAPQPLQLCLLPVHLLGARGACRGSPHGQPGQTLPSKSRRPVHCPV